MTWIAALLNILLFLALAPFMDGVIRRVTARVQSRQGPPLLQPYYDILKLLGKENLVAGNWGFQAAPVMAFASALTAAAFLPLAFRGHALSGQIDIITVIYLLTLGGVAVLFGALSSGNIFASIGASREMVTMIMVEPVLAMTLVLGAVQVRSLGVDSAVFALSETGWRLTILLMAVVYLLALQAFVGRQPFDISEAESEIVEGPFIEYSGPNYALFKLYLMIKQLFYASLFVLVFFSFLSTGIFLADLLLQIGLALLLILAIGLVGATNARLRIDQAVRYYSVLIGAGLILIGASTYGI